MQILAFNASTIDEIDAAFAAIARERADALLMGGDGFFFSRRGQFATLAARHAVPTIYSVRECVVDGGLMSYGNSVTDAYRQGRSYAGRILRAPKLADLPIEQAIRFELVINLTAPRRWESSFPVAAARADEEIE